MRRLLIFFTLFLTLTTSLFASELKQEKKLAFKSFMGAEFDLQKIRSKIIVVNFWAYWCPECMVEMAVLDELYDKYNHQGLTIVGISIDRKRDKAEVLKRVKAVSYPNAMIDDAVVNNFNEVTQVPITYILDENHRIMNVITPFDDAARSLLIKVVEACYK